MNVGGEFEGGMVQNRTGAETDEFLKIGVFSCMGVQFWSNMARHISTFFL